MDIIASHSIYLSLHSVTVDSLDHWDGATLAAALRSPRPALARQLVERDVLSSLVADELARIWREMSRIAPTSDDDVLRFDNLYDLILWVYVQQAAAHGGNDPAPPKLVFRGQRDLKWQLETTAQRGLKTPADVTRNREQMEVFFSSLRSTYALQLVGNEFEEEAVAQHYGFKTSLLDFTVNIDVAAWFATDGRTNESHGVVYMAHAKSLFGQGYSLVKAPEFFRRPNKQRGLFVRCRSSVPTGLTRLVFEHGSTPDLSALQKAVGDLLPNDSADVLAEQSRAGRGERTPRQSYDIVQLADNPEQPEWRHFGSLVADYAGWITDDIQLCLDTQILSEVVRYSETTIAAFVTGIASVAAPALLWSKNDLSWLKLHLEWAQLVAQIRLTIAADDRLLRRLRRAIKPTSVLLFGQDQNTKTNAQTAALRIWHASGLDHADRSLQSIDLQSAKARETIFQALEVVNLMECGLVLLNLHEMLIELAERPEMVDALIDAMLRLRAGVVATSARNVLALKTATRFDLFFPNGSDPWSDSVPRRSMVEISEILSRFHAELESSSIEGEIKLPE